MAKTPKKKTPTAKKEFDIDAFLETEGIDNEVNDKPLSWIPLGEPWFDAIKVPGFPRGYVSLVRGFSNTGKSTAFYEAIAGAQKIGDFPIIFETEGNWSWTHAKDCGVKFIESTDEVTGKLTGKPDGFILHRPLDIYERCKYQDYKDNKVKTTPTRLEPVIEDVEFLMRGYLQKQADGLFPKNLVFLWDSIGTLDGFQSATSNSSNNQWNAGAMGCFQSIVNYMIPSSRDVRSEFTNTFIGVQKIWIDNMGGGIVKHKGGEFMFYNNRFLVHMGGIASHGTKKLTATSLKQEITFGTEVKIKMEKNHIIGIARTGKIASTPHGFVNPDKIEDYKKEHRQFIHDALNVTYDENIEYGSKEVELGKEDTNE